MDTINTVATAAAKAVWGDAEANKEPVSGVKGDVAKGEPYDAGNLDPASQEQKIENASAQETNMGNVPTQETKTGTSSSSIPSSNLASQSTSKPTPGEQAAALGEQDTVTGRDTTIGQYPSRDATASQNDTRAPEDVAFESTKKQDFDTKPPGQTVQGAELKGVGPRPIEAIAKEHGGDAGDIRPHDNVAAFFSKGENMPAKLSEKQPEKRSEGHTHNQTAEEEYVRATGFAADGGDFDASKPGAGREADRLIEEKHKGQGLAGEGAGTKHKEHGGLFGHHHEGHREQHHTEEHGKDAGKDKPSLGERIKAKLHKH